MGREDEREFLEISGRITKAWKSMRNGDLSRYHNLTDADRVKDLMEGKKPEPGEERMAEYLKAVGDLTKLSKPSEGGR